jgi:hypothetical protein
MDRRKAATCDAAFFARCKPNKDEEQWKRSCLSEYGNRHG